MVKKFLNKLNPSGNASSYSLVTRLIRNTSVYTVTRVFRNASMFLLLPVYTQYMTPADFGTVALVLSLANALRFLPASLNGALGRHYFDFRENPEKLKVFFGTIRTFLLLFFGAVIILLSLFGKPLFSPFLNEVAFYPYVVLGLGIVFFEQLVAMYDTIFQMREQAVRYGVFTVSFTVINILLILLFVAYFKMGAAGMLTATLLANVIIFIVISLFMWSEIKFAIKGMYLKLALNYSFPLLPHQISSAVSSLIDRVFINGLINASATGLYDIGFRFGYIMGVVVDSFHQTYAPNFMSAMKKDDQQEMAKLMRIGIFAIAGYCVIAAALSFFADEIITLFTTDEFHQSYTVIPLVAFNYCASGLYYFFGVALFFHKENLKYVSFTTMSAVFLNAIINYFLIQLLGIQGAALAVFLTTLYTAVSVAFFSYRNLNLRWHFGRIVLIFILNMSAAVLINEDTVNAMLAVFSLPVLFLIKFALLFVLATLSLMIAKSGSK